MKVPAIQPLQQAKSLIHKRIRTELTSAFILSATIAEMAHSSNTELVAQDKFVHQNELAEADTNDDVNDCQLKSKPYIKKIKINHFINSVL